MYKKKRILYGLEATGGGALKHLAYLTSYIDKNRFVITVILSTQREDYDDSLVKKVRNSCVRLLFIPMSRNINLFTDILAFLKIYWHIRNNNYEIVHAHSSKAGALFRLAAWMNKVPQIVYTPHCFFFQSKQGFIRKFYILLEKWLGLFCHKIVVSEHEKKLAIFNNISPEEKLVNINNAINFNEYKQYCDIQKIKAEWDIPSDYFVVGAVGRLTQQKDWNTFIKAAELILEREKKIIFIIAGEGSLKAELSQIISDHRLTAKIRLLGHVNDVSKVYSIMDLFVSTSLWEGLPYAFLEAGHYKKPVIATGTYDHIPVNKYFGFVTIPIKKHQIIANKVLEVIRDKTKVKALGEKTFKVVTQKYSFKQFVEQHQFLYLEN